MILVKVMGGLGNQMFQYALYRSLRQRRPEDQIKLDLSHFDEVHDDLVDVSHNGYELERVFGCGGELATAHEIALCSTSTYREKVPIKYEPEVFTQGHGLLTGYWQNERYFEAISGSIRSVFAFHIKLDDRNRRIEDMVRRDNSVGIHIRRKDFLVSPPHNIVPVDFYRKAVRKIQRRIRTTRFFIFSDDMEWVRGNLVLPNGSVLVDWNQAQESWKDMYLMSLCNHNILANSTFSWWAAWLNNKPGKVVICPDKWFVDPAFDDANDHLPAYWTKIRIKYDQKKRNEFIFEAPIWEELQSAFLVFIERIERIARVAADFGRLAISKGKALAKQILR
jgi:hypothetical protein